MFESEKDWSGVRWVILETDGHRFRGKLHRMEEKNIYKFNCCRKSSNKRSKDCKNLTKASNLEKQIWSLLAKPVIHHKPETCKLNCEVLVNESSSDDPAVVQTDANSHSDHRAEWIWTRPAGNNVNPLCERHCDPQTLLKYPAAFAADYVLMEENTNLTGLRWAARAKLKSPSQKNSRLNKFRKMMKTLLYKNKRSVKTRIFQLFKLIS